MAVELLSFAERRIHTALEQYEDRDALESADRLATAE